MKTEPYPVQPRKAVLEREKVRAKKAVVKERRRACFEIMFNVSMMATQF